jgi:mannose-1-phosphate guanylyltransferase
MHNHARIAEVRPAIARRALVVGNDTGSSAALHEAVIGAGFAQLAHCARTDVIPYLETAGRFDLIVLNTGLEGGAALDLLVYLRHRLPRAPILFVSAADEGLLRAAASERGATGCLVSPITAGAVATALGTILVPAPAAVARATSARGRPVRVPVPRAAETADHRWAVVLAGGDGRRLRSLVHHIHGDLRPKQYARIVGARSLLDQTLDRVSLLVSPWRTALVSLRRHRRYLADTAMRPGMTVLPQPYNRGTAPGIMLPVHWIAGRDRDATVAIFPSDHFVAHEQRFIAHVRDAVAFVEQHPSRIVLIGIEPTEPESEYGWIAPGAPVGRVGLTTVMGVEGFVEKPSPPVARACLEAGALWNTFVVVARVSTLIDVERQLLPLLHAPLAAVAPLLGTSRGVTALRRAYAGMPNVNFSSAVLERCAPILVVTRLRDTLWCDWGSPRRVVRTLRQMGHQPDWLESFDARQLA